MKTAGKHPGTIRARCPECGRRALIVAVVSPGQPGRAIKTETSVACAQAGGCGWHVDFFVPPEFDPRQGRRYVRAIKREGRRRVKAEQKSRDFWKRTLSAEKTGKETLAALAMPAQVLPEQGNKRGPSCAGCSIDGLCKTQDDGQAIGCAGRH